MVQGRGKRADYAFYTAPNFSQARFMTEAKKPSRQLENAQDCFQAIRYGWNSNTPIAVLTDFEQFLVLDSRYKPSVETAANRIIKKFHYTEFADEEKFKETYFLFSREAIGNNSLEDFAKTLKGGKGAKKSKVAGTTIIQPIDEEFLSELDEQRLVLAKAFKNRNAELDGETLTEITQRTLDRLVFLRFLEDKLVEPDSVIDSLGKKSGSAWRDFIGEMPRLNQIYNGTLFRHHTILDNPNFAPDERAFEKTRDWLAHNNSPYDFNSIPIHILGSIYERFLGKTIETTDKRATVVDKPEVRKAGGVYYTPEYIVRYIVANTIGKLIEGKTPEEIAALRFADIACGSGSFLLGVFDYLIAYHVEYYSGNILVQSPNAERTLKKPPAKRGGSQTEVWTLNKNKKRRADAVKQGLCRETIEGNLQLTIQYKRELLLNNIYGVDLDAQATEVAQLSLYLKLLEEETTATKQQFLSGFREQLLPSLNKNIVHGNSLIDYDIMDGMLFDTRELKQLNPMSFQTTFPEVFQKGFVKSKDSLPINSFVIENDLIVQNIVAHIMNPFEHIKIIGAVVSKNSHADIVILDTVNRLSNISEMSSQYLLALLHSKLINWYVYRFIFAKAIRTMHFDTPVSDKLPIRTIDFTKPPEKAAHDRLVELVEKMLGAKKSLAAAQTDKDKQFYQRFCESLDNQIDNLVYQLYELTQDEINIVEGKN